MKWVKVPGWLMPPHRAAWAPAPGLVLSMFAENEVSDWVWYHEWAHSHLQGRRYGPFYQIMWLWGSITTYYQGKHIYRDHPFEVEANRIADRAIAEGWVVRKLTS